MGIRSRNLETLKRIFNAQRVAVVGASNNPHKLGYTILNNILTGGYHGTVYPVNLKEEQILGIKSYSTLSAIPGTLDLVVVVVPSEIVPGVLEEAGKKGTAGAVVVSGGFREIGRNDLENSLIRIAEQTGIRIIGPNCQGFSYLPNNLCASWPLLKTAGKFAVISQSGTIAASLGIWAETNKLGISCCVSLGNRCDVDEEEIVKFLAADGRTRVIAIYTEGLRDGRRFMEAAKEITPKIPIIVLRGGRTSWGQQAAQSHTKSLAGRYEVFSGFARDAGVSCATTLEDLYEQTKALALIKSPPGKRVLIVTSSGACGVLASDMIVETGLQMAHLPEKTVQRLKKWLPPYCFGGNPFDLTGDANSTMYERVVTTTSGCGEIDAYCLIFGDPLPDVASMVVKLREKIDQPIVVTYLGGGKVEKREREIFYHHHVPVYDTPEKSVLALATLVH